MEVVKVTSGLKCSFRAKLMKGIILAGGAGTRLYPMTIPLSKQLLPVYDKPMIYYPISTLMLAGIREILLITTPADLAHFQKLLAKAERWGIRLSFAVQPKPEGLPQAFMIGRSFIANDNCALILGDNIFYGYGLSGILRKAAAQTDGATVFGYHVPDPQRYGVIEFGERGEIISIEEKPGAPRSHIAITGLYFCDNGVADIASKLRPSQRGELEITDVIRAYWKAGNLQVELMGRGHAWFDSGTPDSLLEAAHFVQTIEKRQGLRISCPEEVAWRSGWISKTELRLLAEDLMHSSYGTYLHELVSFA
jgi:glucose-1-phosphate thymidylyltransferase